MASARVFFSKHHKHRNGFISEEVPVVENGYDMQESDEDEVFVQDPSLEISASKPLMHPRNKGQRTKVKTKSIECRLCAVCKPIFYFVALVSVLCGVMATIVYFANRHRSQPNLEAALQGAEHISKAGQEKPKLIGCDKIDVEDVWVVGFPKLLTESAFRLVDVNKDGLLDVIFGFATGVDGYRVKDIVCDIYFGGKKPCFGGVMALEGATGKELWRLYTVHEIYGLNCEYDLNKDGVKDCLASGRAGTLVAISCKEGTLLWKLQDTRAVNPVMNMYTARYISDVDGDDTADVIVVHGGDPLQEPGSAHRLSGRIIIISGKTGTVLRWTGLPDHRESYYSPQLLTQVDGSQVLLFGTGGETHNGSLWRIDVTSLLKGRIERAVKLSSDTHKGFMTPPALADITQDGVEDIIIPLFNSTLLAFNGKSYLPLWSVSFPSSETYSTPAVGYFNDDEVPDFMVKYAHGPGFPVYYYSETTVIDGKTGKKLIDPPLRDTIGGQSSPLTISMGGVGNDIFLVWMADCKGNEGSSEEFTFVKGTKPHDKGWANLCRLMFNTEEYSKLVAISSKHPKTAIPVFNSMDRKKVEHSKWINTTAEAYEYIMKHSEILEGLSSGSGISSKLNTVEVPEYQGTEELYNEPQYKDAHRTSSKKGPGGRAPNRNSQFSAKKDGRAKGHKQDLGDGGAQYYHKGDTSGNYNQEPEYNNAYLSQTRQLLPEDTYGYAYKDSNVGNNYLSAPYGSYYPTDDTSYNAGRDGYYRQGYKRKHKSARKRSFPRSLEDLRDLMPIRSKRREVFRRHVGPHDDEGFQRLISTGTLAPTSLPASHADHNNTIDIIFATYWVFPSKTQVILPEDQKCIAKKMAEEGVRYNPESPFYQMSHDKYEEAITLECLKASGNQFPEPGSESESENVYNPFNLKMGQMTVYRLRLKLSCSQSANMTDGNIRCASVQPFNQQKWAAYMGSNGDSHWLPPVL